MSEANCWGNKAEVWGRVSGTFEGRRRGTLFWVIEYKLWGGGGGAADKLRIKSEAGGFCGTVVERWDWQVAFGILLDAFGCWDLGVGSLWRWGNLGYCYFPQLYLLSFSSLWLALVYAMMILNLSMHTTGTPGGGEHVKWLHNYNCPSYPLTIHIT